MGRVPAPPAVRNEATLLYLAGQPPRGARVTCMPLSIGAVLACPCPHKQIAV